MKLYALGGMNDDGMDVDPISGNDIPAGSLASEVRDDIPAQVSGGEYIVPADVVRFFGVKYFEDLRQEAKMGLQSMEADGRIGGEPMNQGQSLTEEDLAGLQDMIKTGAANGGLMDKIAYTAMNDPMVNERMNANGMPVKFAVGGLAQSGYSNPTEIDNIISQVSKTIQQRPEIIQELAKRGITINRTDASMSPAQMQQANTPAQTTTPVLKAATGGPVIPMPTVAPVAPVDYSTPTRVPSTFGTLGGSYFTPDKFTFDGSTPGVVAPPEAPVVAPVAQVTCPAGYVLDPATNSCVPVKNNDREPKDTEPTADPGAWMDKYDYTGGESGTDFSNLAKQTSESLSGGNMLTAFGLGGGIIGKFISGSTAAQAAANIRVMKAMGQDVTALEKELKVYVKDRGLQNLPTEWINGDKLAEDVINKHQNLKYTLKQEPENVKAESLTTAQIQAKTSQSKKDNDNGVYSPGGIDVASVSGGGKSKAEKAAVQTSRENSAANKAAVDRAAKKEGGVTRANVESSGGTWATGGRARGGLMKKK